MIIDDYLLDDLITFYEVLQSEKKIFGPSSFAGNRVQRAWARIS